MLIYKHFHVSKANDKNELRLASRAGRQPARQNWPVSRSKPAGESASQSASHAFKRDWFSVIKLLQIQHFLLKSIETLFGDLALGSYKVGSPGLGRLWQMSQVFMAGEVGGACRVFMANITGIHGRGGHVGQV